MKKVLIGEYDDNFSLKILSKNETNVFYRVNANMPYNPRTGDRGK